jgi:hypothetical protein
MFGEKNTLWDHLDRGQDSAFMDDNFGGWHKGGSFKVSL